MKAAKSKYGPNRKGLLKLRSGGMVNNGSQPEYIP